MELMKDLAVSFRREFGFDSHNSMSIDSQFRIRRELIAEVLSCSSILFSDSVASYWEEYLLKSKSFFRELSMHKKDLRFNSYIFSIIHMLNNRLFVAKNRQQELIVYSFMEKHYKSLNARSK